MSKELTAKEIIKQRADDKKKLEAKLEGLKKFGASKAVTAGDARSVAEAAGGKAIETSVEEAWTKIMDLVKVAAVNGQAFTQVPAGPTHHPEVKAQIIKRLDKAGFKHELVGINGYIYW